MLISTHIISVNISREDRATSRADLESYWKEYSKGIRDDFVSGKTEFLHFQESGRVEHFYPIWTAKQRLFNKLGIAEIEPPEFDQEIDLTSDSGIRYNPGGLTYVAFFFTGSESEIDAFMEIISDFVELFLKELDINTE